MNKAEFLQPNETNLNSKRLRLFFDTITPSYANFLDQEELKFFGDLSEVLYQFLCDNYRKETLIQDLSEYFEKIQKKAYAFNNPHMNSLFDFYHNEILRYFVNKDKSYMASEVAKSNQSNSSNSNLLVLNEDSEHFIQAKKDTIQNIQNIKKHYNISVVIQNSCNWKEAKQWTERMFHIIGDTANRLGIPSINHFHDKITLSFSGVHEQKEVGMAFSNERLQHVISISELEPFYLRRYWLHEFTHALDHDTGYLYNKNNLSQHSFYFSHILLQLLETNSIEKLSQDSLIKNILPLLAFSLSGEKLDTFIEQQKDKKDILKHLERGYLVHLLDQIHQPWEKLNETTKSYLKTLPVYKEFIYSYLHSIQEKGVENTIIELQSSLSRIKDKKSLSYLQNKYISFFNELESIFPQQVKDMFNISQQDKFNEIYSYGVLNFMKTSNLFLNQQPNGEIVSYISHSNLAKNIKNTNMSIYWGKPLEMFARSVEKLNDRGLYLSRFKDMIHSKLHKHDVYLDNSKYHAQNQQLVKLGVQSMFHYIEQHLLKEQVQKKLKLPRHIVEIQNKIHTQSKI